MDEYTNLKAAIQNQGALIVEIIKPLTVAQWQAPSRLSGWDVFTLVAHTMRAPLVVSEYGATTLDVPPKRDRYNYYHFEGPTIAAAVSQRAHSTAASLSRETIVTTFEQVLAEAMATLNRLDPAAVITSTFGPIRVDDYSVTRIIELSIHGLDLLVSLGQPLRLDPQAQAITVDVLEKLLNRPRPADLTDDLQFIEVAAGRVEYQGLKISAFS